MNRVFFATLAGLLYAASAPSKPVAIMPPVGDRLARASCVVIGKVTEIEKQSVRAESAPGAKDAIDYQVAVVKIDEPILGAQGLTHLRVGLRQGAAAPPLGVAGSFVLVPHHEQNFFQLDGFQGFFATSQNPAAVEQLRRLAKLLNDPMTGLKSKDADERFQTAALLLARYRDTPTQKMEAIAAEESKLILEALRGADWKRNAPDRLSPQQAFSRLALTARDGWQQPADFARYEATAKEWLAKHAGSYRIQRFVNK